jgi:DNA-binding NarL/FixJ family response regulator
VLGGAAFTEPASIREIADALVITEAAVKQHLAHLYDKFAIHGGGERRRVQLANEALRRGAVTIAALRQAAARDDTSTR